MASACVNYLTIELPGEGGRARQVGEGTPTRLIDGARRGVLLTCCIPKVQ